MFSPKVDTKLRLTLNLPESAGSSHTIVQNQFGFSEALELFPSAAIFCSPVGIIIASNSHAMDLLEETNLKGRDIADYIEPVTAGESPTHDRHQLNARTYTLRLADERFVSLQVSARPLRDAEKQLVGCFYQLEKAAGTCALESTHSDCLEKLRQAEAELLMARESAETAALAKSQFLSNMSHELRTPLNAVIGMSEVLWETQLTDEQRQLLAVLKNGGKNLLTIINDILEHSGIENGRVSIETASFDLPSLLSTVVEPMLSTARDKGIDLSLNIAPTLRRVSGDSKRLQQVLTKLVGNALKFTERGTIRIKVCRDLQTPQDVCFSISDTGIGIPADKLNELFQRFSQADLSSTKRYGGAGLGLAISRQLVELMGGAIWAESECGQGATFHFKIRLPSVETPTGLSFQDLNTDSKEASVANPLKILVVEDSKDNAFLVANYLKNIDCELHFAENGKVAVEKFGKSNFDLVLMDLQMPEMDGYAATRWIRILELPRSRRVPIIALTAFTFPDEIKKSLDAGCDAHLSKPISRRTLLKAIEERVAYKEVCGRRSLNQCEL